MFKVVRIIRFSRNFNLVRVRLRFKIDHLCVGKGRRLP